jgi:photosystem II stability/assembly factor-like uncharacterized protein
LTTSLRHPCAAREGVKPDAMRIFLAAGLLFAMVLAIPVRAADYTFLPALPAIEPESMQLLDIARCGLRLLAVGERGVVVYSDDDGESWRQARVPVNQTLTAVACLPNGGAWVVGHGGVIIFSDDKGENWNLQFDGVQANQQWLGHIRRQHEELQQAAAAAGDAERAGIELDLEDADYALEDAQLALETGPADPFLDVWFRDANYGLAVGAYGMIYRTNDGGANWQLRAGSIENPDRYHYYSLIAAADGNLFLSGEAGLLYRSRDGGETWQQLDSGYDGSLFGLVATRSGAVLCFGLRGNILRSEDGGDSWQGVPVADDPGFSLYDGVQLGDASIVLIGTAGIVLSSSDAGQNFTSRITASRSTFSGIVAGESDDMLAVGMDGLQRLSGNKP